MDELSRKAWETRDRSTAHPPRRALEACLDDINTGKIDPVQVICVVLLRDEDDSEVSVYQAGEQNRHGIVGTLFAAQTIINEGI